MDEAAAALDFERAARVRDKITPAAAAAVAPVRRERDGRRHRRGRGGARGERDGGQPGDDPRRPPRRRPHVLPAAGRSPATLAEGVAAFLPQHYLERPVPPTIIAPEADDAEALAEVLTAAVGAQGADRHQPRRRAARVGDDGDAERRARDPPEARAEGDAGRAAGRAAGCARPAVHGAAHRVLRRVAHDGRGGGRVVRDLRQARDAAPANTGASTSRPKQRGRRLRGDARGADAPHARASSRASIRRRTCW